MARLKDMEIEDGIETALTYLYWERGRIGDMARHDETVWDAVTHLDKAIDALRKCRKHIRRAGKILEGTNEIIDDGTNHDMEWKVR